MSRSQDPKCVYEEESCQCELTPYLKLKPGDVGRYVLLPGDPKRTPKVARYFDNSSFVTINREFSTYTGTLLGEKVSVVSTGIGGPSAAIAIEELVSMGADTFIRIGTAGGMQMEILPGSIAIPTGAIRSERTTDNYLPKSFPAVPHPDLVAALVETTQDFKEVSFHTGIVHCKDSFYGQHSPESMPVSYDLLNCWDAYRKAGAICSEMESATLFVMSTALKVRGAAVFLVPANQIRREAGIFERKDDQEQVIKFAIAGLKRVIASDKK